MNQELRLFIRIIDHLIFCSNYLRFYHMHDDYKSNISKKVSLSIILIALGDAEFNLKCIFIFHQNRWNIQGYVCTSIYLYSTFGSK